MNKLMLFAGIVFVIGGVILKLAYSYYETKVLPNKSRQEQEKYFKLQSELSKKGAYNIPFKDRKLISNNNTVHEFNNFFIVLGIIALTLGVFFSKLGSMEQI